MVYSLQDGGCTWPSVSRFAAFCSQGLKSISGHKSDSIFERYNITDTKDQRQALRQVQEYRKAAVVESTTVLTTVVQ